MSDVFEAFFASKNHDKQKFVIEFMFDGNLKLLKLQQGSRILICNRKSGQVRHYSFKISTQEDQVVKNIINKSWNRCLNLFQQLQGQFEVSMETLSANF